MLEERALTIRRQDFLLKICEDNHDISRGTRRNDRVQDPNTNLGLNKSNYVEINSQRHLQGLCNIKATQSSHPQQILELETAT